MLAAWAPVVVGMRSVCTWDLFFEHLPFRAFAAQAFGRGELPLWAPGVRAGYPLHANGEASLLSPIEAPLRAMLPPHRASDATFVLASLLAALLAARLARRLGAGVEGAILAGIAFGLGGRMVAAAWPNAAVATALMPGLLLAVERLRHAPRAPGSVIGLALALGALLLAGRPQTAVVALLLAAAYAVAALAFTVSRPAADGARMRDVAWSLLLAASLGLGLGAAQALPTLGLAAASNRAGGMPLDERAHFALEDEHLPATLVAQGGPLDWPEARAHVGLATLALAVTGFAAALRQRRPGARDAALIAFPLAAALAYAVALGGRTPLYGLVSALPILDALRVPARFLAAYALLVSLAGGLALGRVLGGDTPARRAGRWLAVAAVAAELIVSAWRVIPWARPEAYTAQPQVLAALRALQVDASGAAPRYLAPRETWLGPVGLGRFVDPDARDFVERFDAVGGNRALLFGLESATGYGDPLPRWQEAFLKRLTPARLDALGVAAVVSVAHGAAGPELIVQPRPRQSLLPRALLVAAARHAAGFLAAQALLDAEVDPRRTVVIEDAAEAAVGPASFEPRPARIVRSSPGGLEIDVEAPESGWLVIFEAWDPAWTARVDGAAAPLLRAHGFFRAVRVPAGRSRVALAYRPPELALGLALGGVSLAGLIVVSRRR